MVRDLIEGKADMTASLLVTTVTSQKMKFYHFFQKKIIQDFTIERSEVMDYVLSVEDEIKTLTIHKPRVRDAGREVELVKKS